MDNSTVTEIFQRDLLCSGNEDNLLDCQHHRGSRDCPSDHSEDAGVKCNGKVPLTYVCTFWNLVIMEFRQCFTPSQVLITWPNYWFQYFCTVVVMTGLSTCLCSTYPIFTKDLFLVFS